MRFQKLLADFTPAAPDATDHEFVLDTALQIIHPVRYATDQPEAFGQHDRIAAECRFGGKDDWKACTVQELFPIVDHDRIDPAINLDLFPGATWEPVWTRTPCAWRPAGSAFLCVGFNDGSVDYLDRFDQARVRVCRSALPAGQ
jgi:hypothetical protein